MAKVYRTNRGKAIDMEALRHANEKTVAAGNMKVNAKGDTVKGGKVVKTAKQKATESYPKKTQVARTSLKPKVKKDAITTEEPITTVKTRDDGSTYEETLNPDGTIEVKELEKAETKTTKKSTKKKKPSV